MSSDSGLSIGIMPKESAQDVLRAMTVDSLMYPVSEGSEEPTSDPGSSRSPPIHMLELPARALKRIVEYVVEDHTFTKRRLPARSLSQSHTYFRNLVPKILYIRVQELSSPREYSALNLSTVAWAQEIELSWLAAGGDRDVGRSILNNECASDELVARSGLHTLAALWVKHEVPRENIKRVRETTDDFVVKLGLGEIDASNILFISRPKALSDRFEAERLASAVVSQQLLDRQLREAAVAFKQWMERVATGLIRETEFFNSAFSWILQSMKAHAAFRAHTTRMILFH